jgi:hypothetical protein
LSERQEKQTEKRRSMAYHQQQGHNPDMRATFVPGGYDDFYMPAPGPELVAPAPQKYVDTP